MSGTPFQRSRFDADLVFRALKDEEFRARLLANPTEVYSEELGKVRPGLEVPEGVEIRIAKEAEDAFYLVLPCVPPSMQLGDDALQRVARHEQTHRNPCWGLGDPPD